MWGRWGTPQNLFTIIIFFFLKKKKAKHLQISFSNSWYDLHFLRYRAKHTAIGDFRSILNFYPCKTPSKIKILKTEKICWIHHHFTHVCQKLQYMMYGSWDTECNRQNFFVILDSFLPFYPSNNTKNQNFEKMKKSPGHIIILHKCNINDNHIMYHSWDTKCDRNNFCHFGPFFAILPLNNLKY